MFVCSNNLIYVVATSKWECENYSASVRETGKTICPGFHLWLVMQTWRVGIVKRVKPFAQFSRTPSISSHFTSGNADELALSAHPQSQDQQHYMMMATYSCHVPRIISSQANTLECTAQRHRFVDLIRKMPQRQAARSSAAPLSSFRRRSRVVSPPRRTKVKPNFKFCVTLRHRNSDVAIRPVLIENVRTIATSHYDFPAAAAARPCIALTNYFVSIRQIGRTI